MKRILALFFVLLSLICIPAVAGEDFTIDIDVDVSTGSVEQGGSFNVIVDAEGQYVGEGAYSLDRQVLVEENVYLDGHKIGEGNIPFGPGFFNPGDTMSLSDTIPCRVPDDTAPGTYTVEVHFFAAAFGSTVEKTRYAQIQVTEREVVVEQSNPPEIYLSMFPEEMFFGSTSTLTIRVYNPNDSDMEVNLLLKKIKKVGEYFLEDYNVTLGPYETEEIRNTFNLQQKVTDLCFSVEVSSYILNGESKVPEIALREEICATILQRPVLVPSIDFSDFEKNGELYNANLNVHLFNSNGWETSISPNNVIITLNNPDSVDPTEKTFDYYALNRDINARMEYSGPIENDGDVAAEMTVLITYPEQYGIEDETLSFEFDFPTSSKIKDELGLSNGENGDNGNDELPELNENLMQFLSLIGNFGQLSNEEIINMLKDLDLWEKGVFI